MGFGKMVFPIVNWIIEELKNEFPDAEVIYTNKEVAPRISRSELKKGMYIIKYYSVHAYAHDKIAFENLKSRVEVIFDDPTFTLVMIRVK